MRDVMKKGCIITLINSDSKNPLTLEIISDPLGEGSSCIVYEAREQYSKLPCKYRLKELYPEYINGITRDERNCLVISGQCAEEYKKAAERFDRSLKLLWEFAYSDDTGSYTVCPLGRFEVPSGNDVPALYLITQWLPSDSINTARLCLTGSLSQAADICLKTACAADVFHKKGYINFDIKPENILYSPKTDTIAFFDVDTAFEKTPGDKTSPAMFSEGASPEIVNGFEELYSEKTDIFSIGSMLHRFITGENYFSGQYSLAPVEAQLQIGSCEMLRAASSEAVSLVIKIFNRCCPGNPLKRCDTPELVNMLTRLVRISSLPGAADLKEEEFNNEIQSMQKVSRSLRHFYTFLFSLSAVSLAAFALLFEYVSKGFYAAVIISVLMMLIFRQMIYKRAETEGLCGVCTSHSSEHYNDAVIFIGSVNNHQTFELSAPGFIPGTENRRHKFRLILGISAITCAVITAFLSFYINSFPFLAACYPLIISAVFIADYIFSRKAAEELYQKKFERRHLSEIYFISRKSTPINYSDISPECARQIIYNEYKTRCSLWGTADVLTKVLAGVNVFAVLSLTFSFFPADYFHIPENISISIFLYTGMIIFSLLSFITVACAYRFYSISKDMLFTVCSDDSAFVSESFARYTANSSVSTLSLARGIYNFALIQFENGIPIYNIEISERPTFDQYCSTQKARTTLYMILVFIAEVSIIVWHFSIYPALIPLLLINAALIVWWDLCGVYAVNKKFFGIK